MIFRQFASDGSDRRSYLVASLDTREAAIFNPVKEHLPRYLEALESLKLRLDCTLETTASEERCAGALALRERLGSRRIAPVISLAFKSGEPVDLEAKANEGIRLGDLCIEFTQPPTEDSCELAYVIGSYTFIDDGVLIDHPSNASSTEQGLETLFEHIRQHTPHSDSATPASDSPIRSYRTTRRDVSIATLTVEDLNIGLSEGRFTPKEARVIEAYIGYLENNDFEHPSAGQLSELLGDVDRTAVHVLVHNIRWKQIDMDRMPIVLAGQTSKWLKGLQTKPEFTSHEKEFLEVYLRLVEANRTPPSGPEIAEELGGRSVQWVRKRAHTIRRKQRDFQQPVLLLNRKNSQPARGEFRAETRGGFDLSRSA